MWDVVRIEVPELHHYLIFEGMKSFVIYGVVIIKDAKIIKIHTNAKKKLLR